MNKEKIILVTGAGGQLGQCFQDIQSNYSGYKFLFLDRSQVSIDEAEKLELFILENKIGILINCAAYTKVDMAEQEKDLALTINATAPGQIAKLTNKLGVKFIHFSTDYVFPGTASKPYTEIDATEPVNYYGFTKLKGEQLILENNPNSIVIRTSWVYSPYGKNFVKTMMALLTTKEEIYVVSDQFGCPTYAGDLADAVMQMLVYGNEYSGIYHYCNTGIINWYQFAMAIKNHLAANCSINPIETASYPTPAKRPAYSALATEKIEKAFQIRIPGWEVSLNKCMRKM